MLQPMMVMSEQVALAAQGAGRIQETLDRAQRSLIEALAEADRSRSASALAELRLALRSAGEEARARQALQALEELARELALEQRGSRSPELH